MEIEAVKRMSFDNPPKPYWIIEETVDPQGHTIEWIGFYATEASAQARIDAYKKDNKGGS